MFRVLLANKPQKFLSNLDKKSKDRIFSLFSVLESNPWPAKEFDLAKIEAMDDCFRIRIGQYRICYHINTESREITVFRIETKSETTYR